MKVCIHRGTNEIGGNCVEVSTESTRLIFDMGMPLLAADGSKFDARILKGKSAQQLVQEGVLPDVPGLYTGSGEQQRVDAVFISHPHGDHFGFLQYADPGITVCAGALTKELIEARGNLTIASYNLLRDQQPLLIGDITITPYAMDHSACEAYAFEIEANGERVIYTGDFRRHGTKGNLFERFLRTVRRRPDALITEGTNLGRGSDCLHELKLRKELAGICRETEGPVLVSVSSENIDRLCSLYSAAKQSGRIMVVDLHTALKLSLVHQHHKSVPDPLCGTFLNLLVYYPAAITRRKVEELGLDATVFKYRRVQLKRAALAKRKNVLMTVHTSMRKDLAALLRENDPEWLRQSTLIYSLWDGYLKEEQSRKFVEYLQQQGTTVRHCHTSGHADSATLRTLVLTMQPKQVIPIHTTAATQMEVFGRPVRHLRNGEVWQASGEQEAKNDDGHEAA